MIATLRAIAELHGYKLKTVRRVATRKRFHTEKINGILYADPDEVAAHFENSKPGRPRKPVISDDLVEALLWMKDTNGNDWPALPCIKLYAQGKLSDDDFNRFMAFLDREPASADKMLDSLDSGHIWVPQPKT